MSAPQQTEAIVLSHIDVGEEDRIVTFLTRDHGLLRAAAGGAKRLRGGRPAVFDLFVHGIIHFHVSGKEGKLTRIRSAEVIHPFLNIRADYGRLCAASYLAEVTAHCVQEADPVPSIFDLILFCMGQLESGAEVYRILFLYVMRLLKELGMAPELSHCMVCRGPIEGEALLSPMDGGAVHPACARSAGVQVLQAGDMAFLAFAAKRRIESLSNLKPDPESAERLFQALHTFAVHHLGFEPRSFKMLGKGT
ncbi:MAG: DNA repair protein RecO [bacterium]|nr:MAG: DNA repair protein RecO [bacterium]